MFILFCLFVCFLFFVLLFFCFFRLFLSCLLCPFVFVFYLCCMLVSTHARIVLCLSYLCWFCLSLHEMYVLLLYIIVSVCLYIVCLCFWFDWLQNHITFCVQLNIIGDIFFSGMFFFLLFSISCWILHHLKQNSY